MIIKQSRLRDISHVAFQLTNSASSSSVVFSSKLTRSYSFLFAFFCFKLFWTIYCDLGDVFLYGISERTEIH